MTSISSYPYVLSSVTLSSLTSNTRYYYRVYAISLQNDTVYGAVKYFTTESNEKACSSIAPYQENITDAASNNYPTVAVGSQCWLGSNLRITAYADGIALATSAFKSTSGGLTNYGYLYSYDAAMRGTYTSTGNVQGICPAGWHIPSATEWNEMKTAMQGNTGYQCNSTSTYIAKAMASKSGWNSSSSSCAPGYDMSSNNTSGFNAYPNGYFSGSAGGFGYYAYWWYKGGYSYLSYSSATLSTNNAVSSSYYRGVRCVYGANYAPAVSTGTSSSVSVTKATLSGTVNSIGSTSSVTARGICYSGIDENPTLTNAHQEATGTGTGSYTVDLTDLSPGTTYYYRAYASNSHGTSYGEVKSFTTQTGKTVANNTNSSSSYVVSKTKLRVVGTITNGAATETIQNWGFKLYKKLSNGTYTIVLNAYRSSIGTSTEGSYTFRLNGTPSAGNYSMEIDNLEPGATYKFKAMIETDKQGFISAPSMSGEYTMYMAPSVTTLAVGENYTGDRMYDTLKGKLTNAGIPASNTKQGILFSTSSSNLDLKHYAIGNNRYELDRNAAGEFSTVRIPFSPNSTWYVKAYAYNTTTGDTIYGAVKSFTTPTRPTAVTLADNYANAYYYSYEVTVNSVKVKVNASAPTNAPVYRYGVVYSTTEAIPTVGGSNCQVFWNTSDPTNSIFYVTGLFPNTKYYMRAVVRNAASYNGSGYAYSYADASNVRTVKTKLACGQILTDQNGNTYETGTVGSKCWIKSNLKAMNYDNTLNYSTTGSGTYIYYGGTSTSTDIPYYYYPNGSLSNVGGTSYTEGRGRLYNWPAATGAGVSSMRSGQGICPRGWHIPSKAEIDEARDNISNFNAQYAGIWEGSSLLFLWRTRMVLE